MAKKRRMPVLAGQIMLILLAILMIFAWWGLLSSSSMWYQGTSPGLFLILGLVFLVAATLLETVAYEKTFEGNTSTNIPYLPLPPHQYKVCSTCHRQLTFIKEYNSWFCFNCQKYGDSEH